MRAFISFGFVILILWIGLFTSVTLAGLKSGNILLADTFSNGMLSGVVIMTGLFMLPKGVWIIKEEGKWEIKEQ